MSPEEAAQALQALQDSRVLSIIRLSDSLTVTDDDEGTGAKVRTSDVSADTVGYEDMSPASLRADLVHYEDLFSKLRFSYIEQVTKEKFLRAITSDTPVFVEPHENLELETRLVEEKAALKLQKEEIARIIEDLEAAGRALAQRYEGIQLHSAKLSELPTTIENLEAQLLSLREAHPSPAKSANPDLNLPLPETASLLAAREAELATLNSQLAAMQAALPRKTRELERLEQEIVPLQNQKKTAVAQAKEARKRREEGGVDELEERGRWYKSSEAVLRGLLEV